MSDNRAVLTSAILFLTGGLEAYLKTYWNQDGRETVRADHALAELVDKVRLIERQDLLASEELLATIRDSYLSHDSAKRETLMIRLTYLCGPILTMDLVVEVVRRYKRTHV